MVRRASVLNTAYEFTTSSDGLHRRTACGHEPHDSQASSLGHYTRVRRSTATARGIFLGLGITGSFFMTVFCRQLAQFQNQPDAWAAIGCLGPCVLLICIMSTYRGFFQGQGNMLPTSVSQVLEAVAKLIVGIIAAVALLKLTNSVPLAAGGAILGVTASCLISVLPFSASAQLPALPASRRAPFLQRHCQGLLFIAIPITSLADCSADHAETKIYMRAAAGPGYSQDAATPCGASTV